MIDASRYEARFKFQPEGAEKPTWEERPLIYWDDYRGFVLDKGRLRAADDFSNFDGYQEREDLDDTIIRAAIGWWLVHKQKEGPAYWERALAFVLKNGGWAIEVIGEPDSGGEIDPSELNEDRQLVWDTNRSQSGDGDWPPLDTEIGG